MSERFKVGGFGSCYNATDGYVVIDTNIAPWGEKAFVATIKGDSPRHKEQAENIAKELNNGQ